MTTTEPVVPKQFVMMRPPKNREELWWATQALWGVCIPRTRSTHPACEHHTPPFEAMAEAYFAEAPVTVWHGSRGYGGKSYLLSVLAATEMAMLGAEVNLLGGSGAQSLNIHNHTQELWSWCNSPRALLSKDPTKFDTWTTNGGHIRSLMASQGSVRGPHPQRLRLDEIDEMEMEILRASQGQTMRKKGIETQTVMSSTWQYPDGTMSAILDEAKEKGWPVRTWCYRETSNPVDGWLSPDEVARKKAEINTHMWDTEYELQEPNFEGRAIDPDLIGLAFQPGLGKTSGLKLATMRPEDARPGEMRFVTGVDWAKKQDMTVAATFKCTMRDGEERFECIAWQAMNKMPWPEMIGRVLGQWMLFGGEMIHDATGIGDVADDLIRSKLTKGGHHHYLKHVKPITLNKNNSTSFYNEYVAAIEKQDLIYPFIEYAYDEHRYVTDEDLYGKGHTPDSIVAGALAWSLRKKIASPGALAIPLGMTKDDAWSI